MYTWRLLIPGLMFFALIIPLYFLPPSAKIIDLANYKINEKSISYIIVIIFAVIYYSLNIRKKLMKKDLELIINNIKSKLLLPFLTENKIQSSIEVLKENDKLTNIFYFFVDNDNSLSERAKEVFLNGLIWSSFVDAIIISSIGFLIYFFEFLITRNFLYINLLLIIFFILIISFLCKPKIIKKHIEYSNYQLDFIIQHKKKELQKKIYSLL